MSEQRKMTAAEVEALRDRLTHAVVSNQRQGRVPLPPPDPRRAVALPPTLEQQIGVPEMEQMLKSGSYRTGAPFVPTKSQEELDAGTGRFYRHIDSMANPEHFDQAWRRMPPSENVVQGAPLTWDEQFDLDLAKAQKRYPPDPVPDAPGWDWMRQR